MEYYEPLTPELRQGGTAGIIKKKNKGEVGHMKKVDFNKLQAGDLVKVPRTQFAPMRSGWNGWLFSEAVVESNGSQRAKKWK